jgi:Uri superfamily endonuclease
LKKLKNSRLINNSGAYAVIYYVSHACDIKISMLGTFNFKRGYYVYSGSAKKNLLQRVERHLRKDNKKIKWHIDYFINDPAVRVKDYFLYPEGNECKVNNNFKEKGGIVVVKGFGSSDCKNKCGSHFLFLGDKYVRVHFL